MTARIWRLVIEYDRRGLMAATRTVCPACWPVQTETPGRTPYGRTSVSTLIATLNEDDECYYCDKHPEAKEVPH